MSVKEALLERQVIISKDGTALTFKNWGSHEATPLPKNRCEAVLPFFHHLTKAEQQECLRIFHEVDEELVKCIKTTVEFREHVNGFSYVIDNLRVILQLPNDNNKKLSDFVKFLMIASLRTMKILNKQNIELLFAMRGYFNISSTFLNESSRKFAKPRRVTKQGGVRKRLDAVLCDNFNVADFRIDYSESASAMAWYLNFVFFHWKVEPEKTLRTLLHEHAVYRYELSIPVVGIEEMKKPRDRAITRVIERIASEMLHQYSVGLIAYSDVFSLLNGRKTNVSFLRNMMGIFDVNLLDFDNYAFFTYKPTKEIYPTSPFTNLLHEYTTDTCVLSVEEFFERYPYRVNAADADRLHGLAKELFKTLPDLSSYISISRNLYVFIFQMFDKNEQRFLEWVQNTKHLKAQTQQLIVNSCYLEFAADFAREENTPFSLLLPLYEEDEAFYSIVEDQWEREGRMSRMLKV